MRIGFVGLGKLGLPYAATLAHAGHAISGYDVDEHAAAAAQVGASREPFVAEYVADATMRARWLVHDTLKPAVADAELVFVAVQTPHLPDYEGATPAPAVTADFDYTHLTAALAEIHQVAPEGVPVAVVSTVLPGTCARLLEPAIGSRPLVYTPAFAAMGSVVHDLEHPDLAILGSRDPTVAGDIASVVPGEHLPHSMSIESAELCKVAYNVWISAKVAITNAVGELCDRVGADADEVALALAESSRITSRAYLRPGMGDGGPCHPRDLIAMSNLAGRTGMSYDLFGAVARAREAHAAWLAGIVAHEVLWRNGKARAYLLGRAYKPDVPLQDGSSARLVAHYLEQHEVEVVWFDPHLGFDLPDPLPVGTYLLAVPHRQFEGLKFPDGCTVVDPWGVTPETDGVDVVRPGRRTNT